MGCLRVGGSGLGCWRLAEGGGDISVSRREFLRRLRLDGARGAGGGNSLEGRGGDGGEACVVVSSSARGWENVWDCVMLGGAGEVGLFGLGGGGWLSGCQGVSSHIYPNFGLSRKCSRISGRGLRAKFSLRHSQFHPEIQEKGCFPLNLRWILNSNRQVLPSAARVRTPHDVTQKSFINVFYSYAS